MAVGKGFLGGSTGTLIELIVQLGVSHGGGGGV